MKIFTQEIKNLPWQEKPEKDMSPVWRYTNNPIIKRYPHENVARIFNSGVLPYNNEFIGIFRADTLTGVPYLYLGYSKNGIDWTYEKLPIQVQDEKGKIISYIYMYDPRLIKIENDYFIVFCTDNHGATIGIITTKDFKTFIKKEDPFLPFNRNGVLFPRRINGDFVMMSRPSDSGHTPFGDIFISKSPDLVYWGKHRYLMSKNNFWWENVKIGGGCNPIETDVGWLVFYHGVTGTCNGFVYSMGGVILDKDNPEKVLYRCKNFLLTPSTDYEERGFVPNVIFPCSALCDSKTGNIAIYYGAADSYIGLAFTKCDLIIDYIIKNSD